MRFNILTYVQHRGIITPTKRQYTQWGKEKTTMQNIIKAELKYDGSRKQLVTDIAKALGLPAVYKAAPTFAYQVGPYTFTRDNHIEFDAAEIPMDTSYQIGNLRNNGRFEYGRVWINGEEFAAAATPALNPEPQGTPVPDEDAIVVMVPDDLTDEQKANLQNLIEQKRALFLQAFPAFNGIKYIESKGEKYISFPWVPTGEDATPYLQFVTSLIKMVKSAKRISAKANPVTNPKYQFRCFLLRLGFIGAEYSTARKVLMRNLVGNSAWLRGSRDA